MNSVFNTRYWIRWSLFNLFLVAVLGLLMRLKVVFELPWLNQKHLQMGHAQFAFQAWISQLLIVLLVGCIALQLQPEKLKKINRLLFAHQAMNLIVLFLTLWLGMSLVAFLLPLLLFGIQAMLLWQLYPVFRECSKNAARWLQWANVFLVFSYLASVGLGLTFGLGKMTIDSYLGWHYSHLHFQYNGWFWFAAIALLVNQLNSRNFVLKNEGTIRHMMVFATAAGLFLSLLWLKLPPLLEVLAAVAALVQLFAWLLFVAALRKYLLKVDAVRGYHWLLLLIAVAVSLKQLMQPALLHDTMAAWAYGFRPVIIAYLHLVLLGIFSLFLLFYSHAFYLDGQTKNRMNGLKLFALAVLINEFILAWQGAASIEYMLIPGIDWALLGAAGLLTVGATLLWLNSRVPASAP